MNAPMTCGSRKAGLTAATSPTGSALTGSFSARPLRSLGSFGGFASARNGSAVSESCENPAREGNLTRKPSATFSALAARGSPHHYAERRASRHRATELT